MWRTRFAVAIVLLTAASEAWSGGGLRCALLFEDDASKEGVVQRFRDRGPAGLEAALKEYDKVRLSKLDQSDLLQRCGQAIDLIAGQRHATASRLYWYTDLESAKAAAAESGKPILSLRMLGKLTDEFSCANSRFFRTALYANEEISQVMRENFVLHWQSVRPVPKVTIDFGDGRKLERTVTGNSAHYVLDASGQPLDVLPGLYSPKEFLAWLERSQQLFSDSASSKQDKETFLIGYHQQRFDLVSNALERDLRTVSSQPTTVHERFANDRPPLRTPEGKSYPTAKQAAEVAFGKAAAEAPLVRVATSTPIAINNEFNDQTWKAIANLHRSNVNLDGQTVKLMRKQFPSAEEAGAVSTSKAIAEDPILRVVRNFEDSIALDTVRNEYLLHRQIHRWFVEATAPSDFDALNERVYAELFLTPSNDPWLGLMPPGVYTALDGDGLSFKVESSAWVVPKSNLE